MEKEKNICFEYKKAAIADKEAIMNELEAVKEQIESLASSSKKQLEEITLLKDETIIKDAKIKELKKINKKLIGKTTELKTLYKDQWEEKIGEFELEKKQKQHVIEE